MRISRYAAFATVAFTAFLFFCIGRYSSGEHMARQLTVQTQRTPEISAAEENTDRLSDAAPPSAGTVYLAPVTERPPADKTDPTPAPEEAPDSSEDPRGPEVSFPVNINTADAAELDALPGIGEVLSQRIIEYREANGPFDDISHIKLVEGIGEGRFDDIKDLICTQ